MPSNESSRGTIITKKRGSSSKHFAKNFLISDQYFCAPAQIFTDPCRVVRPNFTLGWQHCPCCRSNGRRPNPSPLPRRQQQVSVQNRALIRHMLYNICSVCPLCGVHFVHSDLCELFAGFLTSWRRASRPGSESISIQLRKYISLGEQN
jgi:hypothetical protein